MNYISKAGTMLTKDQIIKSFCLITHITIEDLKSVTRKGEIVSKRHILFWILRQKTLLSFEQIGQICNRDHSTALIAAKKIQTFIEIKDQLGLKALKILEQIEAL